MVLVYALDNQDLILTYLNTNQSIRYANVQNYLVSDNGETLLLYTSNPTNKPSQKQLKWIDIPLQHETIIWSGEKAGEFTFDKSQHRLAFMANDSSRSSAIWYYTMGFKNAVMLLDREMDHMPPNVQISQGALRFSPNSDKLFFNISPVYDNLQKKCQIFKC